MGISITGNVKIPQGKFSVGLVPAPGGPFPVNAVNFDGTNDYLVRGGELTDNADTALALISLWFNMTGNPSGFNYFFTNQIGGYFLARDGSNKLVFTVENSGEVRIWRLTSDEQFSTTVNSGWNHLLIAANLGGSPVGQAYINDAPLVFTESTVPTTGTIDWTSPNHSIGAFVNGTSKLNVDMAELYITNEYLDIDQESNRRKFIDASGFPVDLGSDGSTPTDTAPLIFFSGATASWHTNKGSGDGFTEIGEISDAATSPSD